MNSHRPFRSLAAVALLCATTFAQGQESIPTAGVAVTQNFSGLGSSATATLPTGWKMGPDWASGDTATTRAAGTTGTGVLNGTSAGGFYNFADGVTASSTDRALGFLTSGSYSSPRSIIYAFVNNTGATVDSITVTWNYEKYRSGSRAFDWTFFHGSTSAAATAATGGNQSYAADAANTTIFNPPTSIAKSVTITGLSIPNGGTYYVRWTYAGVGGPTNAQGLGIDDFSITLSSPLPSAPVVTDFTPTSGPVGTDVTIGGSNFTGTTNVAFNGVAATFSNVTTTNLSATVPVGATTGPISVATANGTAFSSSDFVIPSVTVSFSSGSINEGATGEGFVTLSELATSNVVVDLVSSSPADLIVPPSVTVTNGEIFATFDIEAPLDNIIDGNTNVTVTPSAAGFAAVPGVITVMNIDVPFAPLPSGGYTQDFSAFTDALTLPLGWSLVGPVTTYGGDWGTGTSSGSRGNASVFGYQHTTSTGTLQQVLTLRNETGAEITELTVSYMGMVERSSEGRTPAYTVTVDGSPAASLAYSTASAANEPKTASVTGLSIPVNDIFQIIWTSDRGLAGSGSSRQIGIGDFEISVGASLLPPSVGSLAVPAVTIGETTADVSADVTSDGGSPITARGFVYAETTVNNDPTIGGTGVANIVDPSPTIGLMNASLTGLAAQTGYSIKAYATNAEGTTYSPVLTFTTLAPPASFTGSYSYDFDAFTGVAGLPGEWTAISSGSVQGYVGDWTSAASTGGFYGNESNPGVLGYTHTSGTGVLTVTLRLVNNTGSTITDLDVQYLGRVTQTDNTRFPAWTVKIDGSEVLALGYTTESGVDELKTTAISGLSIPNGANFTLTWECDRDLVNLGSSRRIGMADVLVSTSAIPTPSIGITGSLSAFSTTVGNASASQSFNASGTDLTDDITVTAPTDYEVSLDDSSFSSSVTLVQSGGTVSSTPVYVRIAATAPIGNPAGQVNLASTGATDQNIAVTGTVSGAGGGFTTWVAGGPTNAANVGKYAIGGATSPTADDGIASQTAVTSSNLSITAIVRTNDPNLDVFGEGITNLSLGSWSTNGVTMTIPGDQSGVPAGTERQIFSVPRTNNSQFLRLDAILQP